MNLVFVSKSDVERYQARFWTTHDKWKAFTILVSENGFTITEVMSQFLDWYLQTQKSPLVPEATSPDGVTRWQCSNCNYIITATKAELGCSGYGCKPGGKCNAKLCPQCWKRHYWTGSIRTEKGKPA